MEALPESSSGRALPRWAQPELGWPLSLAAGCAGTWVGLQTQIPGMGALLATLLFAPIYLPLIARSRGAVVTLLGLGWSLGVIAAIVGTAMDTGFDDAVSAVPRGDTFARAEIGTWIAGGGLSHGELRLGLFHTGLALLIGTLLARILAGIPALLLAGLCLGLLGAADAWLAQEAALRGAAPMTAAALGIGPHRLLQVIGFFFAWSALAEPMPVWPPNYLAEGRRKRLFGGIGAMLLGLGVQAFLQATWIGAVRGWIE